MKTILICLVAALCATQIADVRGESLNVLKARIEVAKGQVTRVINELTRAKNNLHFDLNNRLYNAKFPAMQSINDMVNPAMEEVRNAVKAAKEAGKDADRCLETGRLALRDISQSAFGAMDSCQSNALRAIVPSQNTMDSTITVAKQINAELDNIFPRCYSGNIFEMQNCITIALGNTNGTIRNLQSTAEIVKNSGNTVANDAYNQGSSCMRDVVSSSRPKIQPAVSSAKDCINNA